MEKRKGKKLFRMIQETDRLPVGQAKG